MHASRFGVTGRALERGLWQLATWNPRDFTTDNHRTVDDRPYGGGPGMVMLAEPLAKAVDAAREAQRAAGFAATRTIHLSPSGVPLTHARVAELAAASAPAYVLLAGRYEGIDERFVAREVDEEIAIGDFVVSGGELPALMLIDAVVRQRARRAERRGVRACRIRSSSGLLDCPHYTRPETSRARRGRRTTAIACRTSCCPGITRTSARWRLMQSLGRTIGSAPRSAAGRGRYRSEEAALLAALRAARCRNGSRSTRRGRRRAARTKRAHQGSPCAARQANAHPTGRTSGMNIIETLEKEEIARLGQDDSRVRAGRHRHRQRERRRRRAQARAGLRRRRHREAQPRPQFVVHRAQDLERRRRGAHVPDLFAAARLDRGQAQGRCAPRQALLPARPLGQVGAHPRKARAQRTRKSRASKRGGRATASQGAEGRVAERPSSARRPCVSRSTSSAQGAICREIGARQKRQLSSCLFACGRSLSICTRFPAFGLLLAYLALLTEGDFPEDSCIRRRLSATPSRR